MFVRSKFVIATIIALLTTACSGGAIPSNEGGADISRAAGVNVDFGWADYRPSAAERSFLDDLSQRTFNYFWETTDPETCLAPDRWPSAPFSSVAAVGFAITAYGVGVEREYVSREAAAERTLKCIEYFLEAPQGPDVEGVSGHQGFFYHFLEFETGARRGSTELSTVDTALLLGGVLFAQSYFDGDAEIEATIRLKADELYRRADWTYFLRNQTGTQAANLENSQAITMGWKPEKGHEPYDWVGYNEGMLVYVLASGSPTHPVSRVAWDKGWAANLEEDWGEFYGQEHLGFEPLFGHQYSHIFIDFRGIQDEFTRSKGIDYFENSRRATYAQRAYAEDNPMEWKGYSGSVWGLTASDGPGGNGAVELNGKRREFWRYRARGVSHIRQVDDGTIVPTAAGGSIPFAPEITIPALMSMKEQYGDNLYQEYGFKDAFNPTFSFEDAKSDTGVVTEDGWFANDYLGIDQGPILLMLENYRSELVWKTLRKNPYVQKGLREVGFSGGWLDGAE